MLVVILEFILKLLGMVYPAASQVKENKDAEDVVETYKEEAHSIAKTESMSDDELVDNIIDINTRLRK